MAVSVLVVEDDRNIQELLQLYLEKEGYAVTVASDGGQGLAKFRSIKPDLVLLDVMMPVMDGWAVCKAIRADSQTPIIMLTAKGETDDKVSGLKSGADDYVTKPFEMKELLARVEAVLRRTGSAPTLCRAMSRAATATDSSGETEITWGFIQSLTFIAVILSGFSSILTRLRMV